MEKGADANDVYVDEGGDRHSLLMDAIIVENVPFAELLVKHGANVNVTDEQGVTTLIQVASRPVVPQTSCVGFSTIFLFVVTHCEIYRILPIYHCHCYYLV